MFWEHLMGFMDVISPLLYFIFFAWLFLTILGGLLGLIADPYYGLPIDRDRKKKFEAKKNAEDHS